MEQQIPAGRDEGAGAGRALRPGHCHRTPMDTAHSGGRAAGQQRPEGEQHVRVLGRHATGNGQ